MFTQISWSSYFTTILFLAVAYYLWIAFHYYRKEPVKIFADKKFIGDESLSMDFQDQTPNELPQPQVLLALGLLNVNPRALSPPSQLISILFK